MQKTALLYLSRPVLAAALAVPAFADTSDAPRPVPPQTNVTQSSTDQKAETTVQFKIDPAYTVTIPGTVELKQKKTQTRRKSPTKKISTSQLQMSA